MDKITHNICSCKISDIWKNYAIGTVPLVIVPFVTLVFGPDALIFVSLIISLGLFSYVRHERNKSIERCAIFPYVSARTMLIFTAFVVLVYLVSILTKYRWGIPFQESVSRHPMIYIALANALLPLMHRLRIRSNTFCCDCLLRNGMPAERRCLGHVLTDENAYLSRHQRLVFGGIFVLNVGFRLMENYNDFSADIEEAVYVFIPFVLVCADCIYVKSRSYVLAKMVGKNFADTKPYGGRFKTIRVLVFNGERLLLAKNVDNEIEITLSASEPYSEGLSENVARRLAYGVFGTSASLRFFYKTVDPVNRRCIEHYFCFVPDGINETDAGGKWVDKQLIETNYSNGLAPLLQAELHRIYTIMQTSKTYTIDGVRKFDVKGYTPQFCFSELKEADVDFNDNRWMLLSKFNCDRLFIRLRRLWYRYVEGLNLK